jgi:hypothetical protein
MRADLDQPLGVRGEPGHLDRSSRPHTSRRRTAAEVEDHIVELRRRERRAQRRTRRRPWPADPAGQLSTPPQRARPVPSGEPPGTNPVAGYA